MLRQVYPSEIKDSVSFDMYFYSLEDICNLILKFIHKHLSEGKIKILLSTVKENKNKTGTLTYWELETNSVFLKKELTKIYDTNEYYIFVKLNSFDDFNIKPIK